MEGALKLAACSFLFLCPLGGSLNPSPVRNVYDEAMYLGATTFLSYIQKAGLDKLLKDPAGNLTVFPPTNVAFLRFPPSLRRRLDSDVTFLHHVMAFHVSRGLWSTRSNNLLFPTLAQCLGRVNVYDHPAVTTISGSSVLLDNNTCSNGKVTILNKVMYPLTSGTALKFICGDNFDMFLLAFTKARMTSLLNGGNMTLLAPTNQAFQSLPPGVLSHLLNNLPRLTQVLQTHMVTKVVYSAYVLAKGGILLPTLSGYKLNVTVSKNSTLRIGGARLIAPDQNVANGVVHVLDKVLLPP